MRFLLICAVLLSGCVLDSGGPRVFTMDPAHKNPGLYKKQPGRAP